MLTPVANSNNLVRSYDQLDLSHPMPTPADAPPNTPISPQSELITLSQALEHDLRRENRNPDLATQIKNICIKCCIIL